MDASKVIFGGAGVAGLALMVAIVAVLTGATVIPLPTGPSPATKPTVSIALIGGELDAARYGFALEGQSLASPGPTIKVKRGDIVEIKFKNVGGAQDQPHTFAVVMDGERYLFGAAVGTRTSPIEHGKIGTVTFTADTAGDFFYICDVPGHRRLGMWGRFIVTP